MSRRQLQFESNGQKRRGKKNEGKKEIEKEKKRRKKREEEEKKKEKEEGKEEEKEEARQRGGEYPTHKHGGGNEIECCHDIKELSAWRSPYHEPEHIFPLERKLYIKEGIIIFGHFAMALQLNWIL